jgi:uncharacterized spore protein YtfJ
MIESKGGFLRLTRAGNGGRVWVKGSAITAIAESILEKNGATFLILSSQNISETVQETVAEILDAITASYREVTRR